MRAFELGLKISAPGSLFRCGGSPRRSRWSAIAWRSHWSRPPFWSLFPWKPRWPREHHRWPRGARRRWPAGGRRHRSRPGRGPCRGRHSRLGRGRRRRTGSCTLFRELDVVNGNISRPAGSPDPDKLDGGPSSSGTQRDDCFRPIVSEVTRFSPHDPTAHLDQELADLTSVHVVREFHLIFSLAENQWRGGKDRPFVRLSWV